MSRVGKSIINIPSNTECSVHEGMFIVKGVKGNLSVPLSNRVKVSIVDNTIAVNIVNKDKFSSMIWGTMQRLVHNAVIGVTDGFSKRLEINGVGYRAQIKGQKLTLQLGYSHDIEMDIPEDITVVAEKPTQLLISGADKQQVGEFAANVRKYRPPEPYKGKGIKYSDEFILRKEGKRK